MRKRTTFKDENGRPCYFNGERFVKLYKTGEYNALSAKQFTEKLVEKANVSESTVKGWKTGRHGPSSIEMVRAIEELMILDPGDSLLVYEEEKKLETTRNIGKAELKAAKKLYKKMNEMICSVRYDYDLIKIQSGPLKPEDIIADAIKESSHKRKFYGHYSDECIMAIRNSSLNLPEEIRNQCIDLVYDTLGKKQYDSSVPPVFDTEQYTEFNRKNGGDNDANRIIYTAMLIENSYEKLDTIFKDYIVK